MALNDFTECLYFTKQLMRGKWFSVFSSFIIMIGAGTPFMFPNYSQELKTEFNYTQTQLNSLGSAKDVGLNLGVIAGLLGEVAPTWLLMIVGSSLNFFSYFIMWLAVTHRIAKPEFWKTCINIGIAANSGNFVNTAVMVSSVQNFADRRGLILGLMKGFIGLGGAVLTQFYYGIYGKKNPSNILLLLAWLPTTINLLFLLTVRRIKAPKNPNELRVFYQFLSVSIILALFIMVLNITQKILHYGRNTYVGACVIIFCLLCLPLLLIVREEYALYKVKKAYGPTASISMTGNPFNVLPNKFPPSHDAEVTETEPSWYSNIFNKPERGEDYTILQALLSIDMALLFMATFCAKGASLTSIDNLGQVGQSLNYPAETTAIFSSLVSVMNFFGRVFSGFVSEKVMTEYKIPRPMMLAIFQLLSCVGQLLITYPYPGSVYAASLIIGFAFGAQVPLLHAIIIDLFGLKRYSTLFNCGQLAVPFGSYILNVEVAGKIYDMEARKQGQTMKGKGLTCLGPRCFSGAFAIMAGVTLLGAVISIFLAFRTREFYKGDIYKRYREDSWMPQMDMEFYCLNDKKKKAKDTKNLR